MMGYLEFDPIHSNKLRLTWMHLKQFYSVCTIDKTAFGIYPISGIIQDWPDPHSFHTHAHLHQRSNAN